MSYGESLREFYRRAASFVDRILKGARPGELPMSSPGGNSRSTARPRAHSG